MIIDVAKAASCLEEARFLLAAPRKARHAASSPLLGILRGPKANPVPHTAKPNRLWPGYPTQSIPILTGVFAGIPLAQSLASTPGFTFNFI